MCSDKDDTSIRLSAFEGLKEYMHEYNDLE
jgi:hypothetical protein